MIENGFLLFLCAGARLSWAFVWLYIPSLDIKFYALQLGSWALHHTNLDGCNGTLEMGGQYEGARFF